MLSPTVLDSYAMLRQQPVVHGFDIAHWLVKNLNNCCDATSGIKSRLLYDVTGTTEKIKLTGNVLTLEQLPNAFPFLGE